MEIKPLCFPSTRSQIILLSKYFTGSHWNIQYHYRTTPLSLHDNLFFLVYLNSCFVYLNENTPLSLCVLPDSQWCPLPRTPPAQTWGWAQWTADAASHCNSWCRTAQNYREMVRVKNMAENNCATMFCIYWPLFNQGNPLITGSHFQWCSENNSVSNKFKHDHHKMSYSASNKLYYIQKGSRNKYTEPSESIQTPWLFPNVVTLQPYSKMDYIVFPLIYLHTIPHNDEAKTVF